MRLDGELPAQAFLVRSWSSARTQGRSSNANSLRSQNSAGFPQICAIFQRDNLRRHFRVRVLHGQPRSPVSVGYVRSARIGATFPSQWTAGAVMGRLLNEILLRSCMAAFAIGVVIAAASLLG